MQGATLRAQNVKKRELAVGVSRERQYSNYRTLHGSTNLHFSLAAPLSTSQSQMQQSRRVGYATSSHQRCTGCLSLTFVIAPLVSKLLIPTRCTLVQQPVDHLAREGHNDR